MSKMIIKNRLISELIPAEYNPRQLTDKQYKDIKKSLKKFGIVDPIIVNMHPNRTNIIVGGHMRAKIWHEMGNDTIPVFEVNLNEEDEMELNIRLNKNTGEWDWDRLANYFENDKLLDWGFNTWEVNIPITDYELPESQEIDSKIEEMSNDVKKSIQIEFTPEDYEVAKALVKEARMQGKYIGGILIESLSN